MSPFYFQEEEEEDDEVFEDIEEMEMDLCALINEHFRMDDDYWFCDDQNILENI